MATFIFINSEDRDYYDSSSPSDFSVHFARTYEFPKLGISLESLSFFNYEFGINNNNKSLTFQENGVAADLNLSLTPGNYSATEFASALKTALDAAGANTYTVSYSSITGKLNITTTIPNTFKITGGTLLVPLGMNAMSSFLSAQSSDHPIQISGSTYADVSLSFNNGNLKTGRNYGSLFGRVPINVGFGSLVSYVNNSSDDYVRVSNEDLTNIHIQLFDDRGRILDLPSNCVVSVVLKVQPVS